MVPRCGQKSGTRFNKMPRNSSLGKRFRAPVEKAKTADGTAVDGVFVFCLDYPRASRERAFPHSPPHPKCQDALIQLAVKPELCLPPGRRRRKANLHGPFHLALPAASGKNESSLNHDDQTDWLQLKAQGLGKLW